MCRTDTVTIIVHCSLSKSRLMKYFRDSHRGACGEVRLVSYIYCYSVSVSCSVVSVSERKYQNIAWMYKGQLNKGE